MTAGTAPLRKAAISSAVVLSFLIGALLVSPSNAAPTTETKTVPAEIVFEKGQRPGDPGNCSAIVFVKWQDVPNTISATVFYTYKGSEKSATEKPPFHDKFNFVAEYNVPSGSHWISVTQGWSDGALPNTCESHQIVQKERYGPPARAELTVEAQESVQPVETKTNPEACDKARKALKQRNKAVSKLLGQLRKAEGKKAKSRIRAKLAKAKASRAKAVQRVAKAC